MKPAMKKLLPFLLILFAACSSRPPRGVEIGGVVWAIQNVGEPGTFVENPKFEGLYYSFEEAQTVCPKGWHVPTAEQLESLSRMNGRLGLVDDVPGRIFSDGKNSIFFPFPASGCYWSSNQRDSTNGYAFLLNGNFANITHSTGLEALHLVRCVK